MKNLPKLNEEKHETNPFIFELKGRMYLQPRANAVIAKGQSIIDTNTGEIINESVIIGSRRVVDKSQFAKIYASEIAGLYNLSKTAMNVFLYLSKVMDYDNRAYFNYNNEFTKLGYKTGRSLITGLRELIKSTIIACDVRPHQYWLNPSIICKGERFAKYTEYVTDEYAERQMQTKQKEILEQSGGCRLNAMNDTEVKPNQKTILQQNIYGGVDEIDPRTGEIIRKQNE